jgi:hypothetical protein
MRAEKLFENAKNNYEKNLDLDYTSTLAHYTHSLSFSVFHWYHICEVMCL